ncbi:MAG TPA: hypothetical protein VNT60_03850, partial [Deinococcales bacterium]|nr:hypothetical protein [Deinococcales bacterium]
MTRSAVVSIALSLGALGAALAQTGGGSAATATAGSYCLELFPRTPGADTQSLGSLAIGGTAA